MTLRELYFTCVRFLPDTPINIFEGKEFKKKSKFKRSDFHTKAGWLLFSEQVIIEFFDVIDGEIYITVRRSVYDKVIKFFQNLR